MPNRLAASRALLVPEAASDAIASISTAMQGAPRGVRRKSKNIKEPKKRSKGVFDTGPLRTSYASSNKVKITCRFVPYFPRAFGDGPHNFEPWSSNEDDTRTPSPTYHTTGRTFELSTDLTYNAPLHGGSSAARTRDMPATRPLPWPPQPQFSFK
ncbi:hypothetical protein TNCV_3209151 [Trichonephila clavipes]|nr:hypothetical protein TNCV_3209151 [Trichonephila clavipes]